MSSENSKTNWGQFIPLVIVFFFWGFVAASNDILIPVFQKAFDLSQVESQLVSLAFYIAYTVGSLIYLLISYLTKGDLINRIGYKNSLALGLVISALGTLLFYPAANTGSFPLMLSGLFIVALGFSLQQTVANPLAIALGPITTGSQRLTLAGGINNFGTTIGPLIVSFAIFGSTTSGNTEMSIESVKIPYLILGVAFLLVAILLKFSSLPDKPAAIVETESEASSSRSSAIQYPQLILGMIAIFVYVGVEVSTASNLPAYMEQNLGFLTKDVAPYISLYWASLMIGRWTGAVEAFTDNMSTQKILRFLAPYLAFGIFLAVNAIANHDLTPFYVYAIIILVLIFADMDYADALNILVTGVDGLIYQQTDVKEITLAVQTVLSGTDYWGRQLAEEMARETLREHIQRKNTVSFPQKEITLHKLLSKRQMDVVRALIRGESVPVIAVKLAVSPSTVATHKSIAFKKLGVNSIVELIENYYADNRYLGFQNL